MADRITPVLIIDGRKRSRKPCRKKRNSAVSSSSSENSCSGPGRNSSQHTARFSNVISNSDEVSCNGSFETNITTYDYIPTLDQIIAPARTVVKRFIGNNIDIDGNNIIDQYPPRRSGTKFENGYNPENIGDLFQGGWTPINPYNCAYLPAGSSPNSSLSSRATEGAAGSPKQNKTCFCKDSITPTNPRTSDNCPDTIGAIIGGSSQCSQVSAPPKGSPKQNKTSSCKDKFPPTSPRKSGNSNNCPDTLDAIIGGSSQCSMVSAPPRGSQKQNKTSSCKDKFPPTSPRKSGNSNNCPDTLDAIIGGSSQCSMVSAPPRGSQKQNKTSSCKDKFPPTSPRKSGNYNNCPDAIGAIIGGSSQCSLVPPFARDRFTPTSPKTWGNSNNCPVAIGAIIGGCSKCSLVSAFARDRFTPTNPGISGNYNNCPVAIGAIIGGCSKCSLVTPPARGSQKQNRTSSCKDKFPPTSPRTSGNSNNCPDTIDAISGGSSQCSLVSALARGSQKQNRTSSCKDKFPSTSPRTSGNSNNCPVAITGSSSQCSQASGSQNKACGSNNCAGKKSIALQIPPLICPGIATSTTSLNKMDCTSPKRTTVKSSTCGSGSPQQRPSMNSEICSQNKACGSNNSIGKISIASQNCTPPQIQSSTSGCAAGSQNKKTSTNSNNCSAHSSQISQNKSCGGSIGGGKKSISSKNASPCGSGSIGTRKTTLDQKTPTASGGRAVKTMKRVCSNSSKKSNCNNTVCPYQPRRPSNDSDYCYNPVNIGDILQGRYQVLRKLGWGYYSTVWLCCDLYRGCYVAIKIIRKRIVRQCLGC